MSHPGAPRPVYLRTLGACLRTDWPAAARLIRGDGFDDSQFVAFAHWHQIGGFLHWHLRDTPVRAALSDAAAEWLARLYASQIRKADILADALGTLAGACAADGLSVILLKGQHLAAEYYGSRRARTSWDLDLLVRREDRPRAQRILRQEGFERTSTVLVAESWIEPLVHAFDYARGEVGVDLHWTLSAHPAVRIDYARLWDLRGAHPLPSLSVLSPEYVLVQLLVSGLADLERGALRLRSLVDLWMVLDRLDAVTDWDRFRRRRCEEGIDAACDAMLGLFVRTFAASDRFANLARSLAERERRSPARPSADLRLPTPGTFGIRRRRQCARLYGISSWQHGLWWAGTLPVRFSVYKPGKLKRVRAAWRSATRKRA